MEIDMDYIKRLEEGYADATEKNKQLQTALASSSYQQNEKPNPIQYQLTAEDMLARLEHSLKGDFVDTDKDGNEFWAKQTKEELVILNEFGVNSIMAIIGNYIDKDTVLSRYGEERINEILADIGDKLALFIYCNFEKMGMDTQYKRTKYEVIVLMIVHKIETAYRRALFGKTSEDINTSKIFTGTDRYGQTPMQSGSPTPIKRKFNLFNPGTW